MLVHDAEGDKGLAKVVDKLLAEVGGEAAYIRVLGTLAERALAQPRAPLLGACPSGRAAASRQPGTRTSQLRCCCC